ncbi:MAG: metalloregulator ArsR/SmtB family transcription factor [Granulosicoccus sp.]
MNTYVTASADPQPVFRALADPTRRQILQHLQHEDMTIGEVTEHFDITRAAIKKHLNILEEGQLIYVEVRGRERINHFRGDGLETAAQWIDYFGNFWDERLMSLKDAIENDKQRKQNRNKRNNP